MPTTDDGLPSWVESLSADNLPVGVDGDKLISIGLSTPPSSTETTETRRNAFSLVGGVSGTSGSSLMGDKANMVGTFLALFVANDCSVAHVVVTVEVVVEEFMSWFEGEIYLNASSYKTQSDDIMTSQY